MKVINSCSLVPTCQSRSVLNSKVSGECCTETLKHLRSLRQNSVWLLDLERCHHIFFNHSSPQIRLGVHVVFQTIGCIQIRNLKLIHGVLCGFCSRTWQPRRMISQLEILQCWAYRRYWWLVFPGFSVFSVFIDDHWSKCYLTPRSRVYSPVLSNSPTSRQPQD